MLSASSSGSFTNIENKFQKLQNGSAVSELFHRYGARGVAALSRATPVESAETAQSWGYVVKIRKTKSTIIWTNDHINEGVKIAIILQYGHATRNGGWVEGRDYINPAMRPLFDEMAGKLWKEMTQSDQQH